MHSPFGSGGGGAVGPTGPAGADGAEMVTFSHDDLSAVPLPYDAAGYTDTTQAPLLKTVTIPAGTLQEGSRLTINAKLNGVPDFWEGASVEAYLFPTGNPPSSGDLSVGSLSASPSDQYRADVFYVTKIDGIHFLRREGQDNALALPSWPQLDPSVDNDLAWFGAAGSVEDDNVFALSGFELRIYGATGAAASVVSVTGPTGATGAVGATGPAVPSNLTTGYTATADNGGTISSGTFTPDPADGNIQRKVNGGAHTLAPPSVGAGDSVQMTVKYTNNGSAGAITTSGFTKVSGSFDTTNGHKFFCYIAVIDGDSHLNIVAMQ